MTEPKPPEDDLLPAFTFLMIGIILALVVVANLPWAIEEPREVEQAFMSHQMVVEGQALVPHVSNGLMHPPLHAWLSVLLHGVFFGHGWEVAWRLPGLLAAGLILWVLWREGDRLFGNNIGSVLAAGAFGLNFLVPHLATAVSAEMLSAAMVCLCGTHFLDRWLGAQLWTKRDHVKLCLLLCGAVLAGGWVVYASLLPGIVAVSWSLRRWLLGGRKWWEWLWLLPLVLYGGWIAWAAREAGGWPFAGDESTPFGQRALEFLVRSLPWSGLLLAMLTVKSVRSAIGAWPVLTWLAGWSLGSVIVAAIRGGDGMAVLLVPLPPLCLLLAGCARYLPRFKLYGQPIGRMAVLLPLLMMAFASVEILRGVRKAFSLERRQVMEFGTKVRTAALKASGRLFVVPGAGYRSLIQARALNFTPTEVAVNRWREGKFDWLVIGTDEVARYREELTPFMVVATSPADRSAGRGCNLLQRINLTAPAAPVQQAKGAAAAHLSGPDLPPPELR